MYVPKDESPKFDPCPQGTHAARCYRFVDLGSHEQTYQGENKGLKRLVMLSFEIPGETMDDGRPFTISKRYNWSMHEKSTLRKHLEAWRGKKFAEEDLGPGGFDIRNVLGKVCTLTVVHNERSDGDIFANVDSVGGSMKGIQLPEQHNETVYVALDKAFFQQEEYDKLSDKLKETIQKSPEWRRLNSGNSYAAETGANNPARDPQYERQAYSEGNPPPITDEDENYLMAG